VSYTLRGSTLSTAPPSDQTRESSFDEFAGRKRDRAQPSQKNLPLILCEEEPQDYFGIDPVGGGGGSGRINWIPLHSERRPSFQRSPARDQVLGSPNKRKRTLEEKKKRPIERNVNTFVARAEGKAAGTPKGSVFRENLNISDEKRLLITQRKKSLGGRVERPRSCRRTHDLVSPATRRDPLFGKSGGGRGKRFTINHCPTMEASG